MRPINCPLAAERDLRSILAVLGRPRAASLRPPRSGTSVYCRLSVGRGGRLGDARTSLDVTGGTCPARAPAGRSPLHPCCGLSASPRARTRASMPARPRPGPARGAGGAAAAHRGCRRTRRARQGPIDCAFCCVGSPRLRRRGDATEGQLSSPHGAGHAACRWRQPPAGLPARSTGSPPCSPPVARPPRTTNSVPCVASRRAASRRRRPQLADRLHVVVQLPTEGRTGETTCTPTNSNYSKRWTS